MKSKSIFLMAVSLGFGLVAAIGITQVMGRNNQPVVVKEEPKLPILVAIQDIDINAELTSEMFTEEEWDARQVPEGAATSFEDLEGMVTTARIGKKGTVTKSNLVEKSKIREKKIPPGFKVIGMKLGADDHLNGLLEAGDLVDIMAVFRGGNRSSTGSTSRTFLRKVRIWSIGSKTKKDIEQNTNAKGSTVVGLLVTEKQSEKIVLAERIAELKLAMRGSEDGDPANNSQGTGAEELQNAGLAGADALLNQVLAQNGGGGSTTKATAPVSTTAQQPPMPMRTNTTTVYTENGPTVYTFTESGRVSRESGFEAEEPVSAGSDSKESLDFDDGDEDIDPASLIDDLDSEPGS